MRPSATYTSKTFADMARRAFLSAPDGCQPAVTPQNPVDGKIVDVSALGSR
jgi:hypothetical protein